MANGIAGGRGAEDISYPANTAICQCLFHDAVLNDNLQVHYNL
jgi:hypothetical protein